MCKKWHEDGDVYIMRYFRIYVLQQMTSGRPNQRIRRRREIKIWSQNICTTRV